MASFYLSEPREAGEIALLAAEEGKHVLKVLRMGVGDELCAIDGCGGRFDAEIDSVEGGEVRVKLLNRLPDNEAAVRITLYQGLPKADKLDFIVQKCTELGGARVCPVKMERSIVKSDAKDGIRRRERLEKIAREATKQCRRASAPEIVEPLSWKQTLARLQEHELVLVPWEDARGDYAGPENTARGNRGGCVRRHGDDAVGRSVIAKDTGIASALHCGCRAAGESELKEG